MGLGGYFLAQSRNWQEIIHAPFYEAYLAVVAGLITFLVPFLACLVFFYFLVRGYSGSRESHWMGKCLVFTYAAVVGIVVVIEVAASILLLVGMKGVRIYLSSLQII